MWKTLDPRKEEDADDIALRCGVNGPEDLLKETDCGTPKCMLKELNVFTDKSHEEYGFDELPLADPTKSYITVTYTFGGASCSFDVGMSTAFCQNTTSFNKNIFYI